MKPKLNLVDIAGLDQLSFWPLAIGWWILIGTFFILMTVGYSIYFKRRRRMQSPEYRMLRELNEIEMKLKSETSQQAATQLSALIRRLALYRHPRSECASLQGEEWLKWLSQKDKQKFDWSRLSKVMLIAPFQEHGSVVDVHALQEVICAAKGWVR